jgi:hypothetical protein
MRQSSERRGDEEPFIARSTPSRLPELPECVVDRFGLNVRATHRDTWLIYCVSRPATIRWNSFKHFSAEMRHALKLYIAHCIESVSPNEVDNTFREVRECSSISGRRIERIEDLNSSFFEDLRIKLRVRQGEYRLHRVRAWYCWMADNNLAGIDPSLAQLLRRWRIPGNTKVPR